MSLLEWSDELALGVEAMDETHREFVEHLNALHEAPQEVFVERLAAFIAHTEAHFEQERRWMEELAFPPMHCHVTEHEGVLTVMRDVRGMVEGGQHEVGRVLARELKPWFENHAGGMDAVLAWFLRTRAAGLDPMQVLAEQSAQAQASCSAATAGGCGHGDDAATERQDRAGAAADTRGA